MRQIASHIFTFQRSAAIIISTLYGVLCLGGLLRFLLTRDPIYAGYGLLFGGIGLLEFGYRSLNIAHGEELAGICPQPPYGQFVGCLVVGAVVGTYGLHLMSQIDIERHLVLIEGFILDWRTPRVF